MARQNVVNKTSASLTIIPGAAGDSFIQYALEATDKFRIGVDDDAADAFKMSVGGALGANDTFIMTAAGERTMPLQPAFLAYITTLIENVTGDGTVYTVIWDAEVFDQNADFNTTTGEFTAPCDGRYRFAVSISYEGILVGHTTANINLFTSNKSYTGGRASYASLANAGMMSRSVTALVDMDATDVAYVQTTVSNSTKVVDINNISAPDLRSWFSGYLDC